MFYCYGKVYLIRESTQQTAHMFSPVGHMFNNSPVFASFTSVKSGGKRVLC